MERTQNKSQHTKLTLEKKILPPLLSGFEFVTFRSRTYLLHLKIGTNLPTPLSVTHILQKAHATPCPNSSLLQKINTRTRPCIKVQSAKAEPKFKISIPRYGIKSSFTIGDANPQSFGRKRRQDWQNARPYQNPTSVPKPTSVQKTHVLSLIHISEPTRPN